MRFLFATIQGREAAFYGRVGSLLSDSGHAVSHVTYSRRAARELRRAGASTWCLADEMKAARGINVAAEAARIEAHYPTPTVRDLWISDPAAAHWPEQRALEWTVRQFCAVETIFDQERPDIAIPEVGREVMRTAIHLIGLERRTTVLFLMYTLFPNPLRLYANTMHAPIVAPEDVRELSAEEQAEIEGFIADFTQRAEPIRRHRRIETSPARLPEAVRHFADRLTMDRDNPYLTPERWALSEAREALRRVGARALYSKLDNARPFIYFPLHVTDDYKIKRLIPHCTDQASLVEQVADSLPHGYDLVLKEHPMSVGRNSLGLLRRLTRIRNVRLLDPHENSHRIIEHARAIAVISSTVGLEALLHGKPVLTLGQPFYAGYGVTVDVDSFREIRGKVLALLEFEPDRELTLRFLHAAMRRCYPGAPVLVDESDTNAQRLADSLERAAGEGVPGSSPEAQTV